MTSLQAVMDYERRGAHGVTAGAHEFIHIVRDDVGRSGYLSMLGTRPSLEDKSDDCI